MRADIDLAAFRRNLDLLTQRVAPAALMVVVKADAYGHGLEPIARTAVAAGVPWLGVLDAQSALRVRALDLPDPVRLFLWLFADNEDYEPLVSAGVELGISHRYQLEAIAAAAERVGATAALAGESGSGIRALVHLKKNTGLNRNGASDEDWPFFVARALELERAGIVRVVAAWTHLGEASAEEDSAALSRFDAAVAVAEELGARFELRHVAASSAAFTRVDARYDVVRIGAFAYGIAPGGGVAPAEVGIEPVMTLSAPVTAVAKVDGELVVTVGIGFTAGVPTAAGGRVSVAVNGVRAAIRSVGAHALTAVLPDSGTDDPSPVSIGDRAFLFGSGLRAEATLQEWADALDTIGEELVVRVSAGVPRAYSEN